MQPHSQFAMPEFNKNREMPFASFRPRFMTIKQTEHYTSFSRSTLYADAARGLLNITKIGNSSRVTPDDADAYLAAKAAA